MLGVDAPAIEGFGHIDLTVSDGERSAHWWQEVMGFSQVAFTEKEDAWKRWHLFHPSGLIVSVIMHTNGGGGPFDERTVGLDHLAFRVSNRAALRIGQYTSMPSVSLTRDSKKSVEDP